MLTRFPRFVFQLFLAAILLTTAAGCGDAGTTVDGDDAGADGGSSDGSTPDGGLEDAATDDGGSGDASVEDGGLGDAASSDAAMDDAGALDGGTDDDAGPADLGASDTGPEDLGTPDSGPVDMGPPDPCAELACSEGSYCNLEGAEPVCLCEESYQDNDGDGECLPRCTSGACGTGGYCDDSDGFPICVCDEEYTGPMCQFCQEGYQDMDGDGVCRDSCSHTECDTYQQCVDESGTAECVCAPGYNDPNGDLHCVADCDYGGCGANATCEDESGEIECTCVEGTTDEDGDGSCSYACTEYGGTPSVGPGPTEADPTLAFDGDISTSYSAIQVGVNHLTYDYGASSSPVIVSYSLLPQPWGDVPFSFQLLGSHDGETWTTLDSQVSHLSYFNPRRFEFANSTGYRYYRLSFDITYGYVRIYELGLNTCP